MRKFIVFLVAVLIGGFLCLGQFLDEILSVKVVSPSPELKRGEINPIVLEITIKQPYHINSDVPADEFVVPTSISFDPGKGLKFDSVKFPEAEVRSFSFSENPLSVYEGTFKVTATLFVPSSFKEDEVMISGTINYQACDDVSCLAPADLLFSQTFPVTGEIQTESAADKEEGEDKKE